MKRDLLKILVCPVCKEALELKTDKEESGEIITGTLYCPKGNVYYPIEDTIPNLLPPGQHK